jgi:hypothetical protein
VQNIVTGVSDRKKDDVMYKELVFAGGGKHQG